MPNFRTERHTMNPTFPSLTEFWIQFPRGFPDILVLGLQSLASCGLREHSKSGGYFELLGSGSTQRLRCRGRDETPNIQVGLDRICYVTSRHATLRYITLEIAQLCQRQACWDIRYVLDVAPKMLVALMIIRDHGVSRPDSI